MHENQACQPTLSDNGKLCLGKKVDFLICLEGMTEHQCEAPFVDVIILDGAALANMLKPGVARRFDDYANCVSLTFKNNYNTLVV